MGKSGRRQELVKGLAAARMWAETCRVADSQPPDNWSQPMSDLVFLILTVAFFTLTSMAVKGAERL